MKDHGKILENQLAALEKQREKLRDEWKTEGYSGELHDRIDALSAQINDLKPKVDQERRLKERYRMKYEKLISSEDFDRLWITKLRDEALIAAAEGRDKPDYSGHPLLSSARFWND